MPNRPRQHASMETSNESRFAALKPTVPGTRSGRFRLPNSVTVYLQDYRYSALNRRHGYLETASQGPGTRQTMISCWQKCTAYRIGSEDKVGKANHVVKISSLVAKEHLWTEGLFLNLSAPFLVWALRHRQGRSATNTSPTDGRRTSHNDEKPTAAQGAVRHLHLLLLRHGGRHVRLRR